MHPSRLSNRLKGYDYSRNALYFVTSCVQDRVCCFGIIKDGRMFPNEYGKIAEQQWHWLGQQYLYIVLHSFVVMPNHIHGIIEIDDRAVIVGTGRDLSLRHDLSLQQNDKPQQPETKIKSLSEIMGAYKTTSSKQIHLAVGTGRDLSLQCDLSLQPRDLSKMNGPALNSDRSRPVPTKQFKWQRSFHDHIIRNEESYARISNYIQNNPLNWKEDTFNTWQGK